MPHAHGHARDQNKAEKQQGMLCGVRLVGGRMLVAILTPYVDK